MKKSRLRIICETLIENMNPASRARLDELLEGKTSHLPRHHRRKGQASLASLLAQAQRAAKRMGDLWEPVAHLIAFARVASQDIAKGERLTVKERPEPDQLRLWPEPSLGAAEAG